MSRPDVVSNTIDRDPRAAETDRPTLRRLCRHPAARIPHRVFPRGECFLKSEGGALGLGDGRCHTVPCNLKRRPRAIERIRRPDLPAPARPLPSHVAAGRVDVPHYPDAHVAVPDAPLFQVFGVVAAAGEGHVETGERESFKDWFQRRYAKLTCLTQEKPAMGNNLRSAAQYIHLANINRARMRRTGLTPVGDRIWTEAEDNCVRCLYPDYSKMKEALPLRSHGAIRLRVQTLGIGRKNKRWTTRDLSNMRKHYPTAAWSLLNEMFPGRTRIELRAFAYDHGIIRKRQYLRSGIPIIDACIERAVSLNLSLRDLDEIARTRGYFEQRRWKNVKSIDGRHVLRAIKLLDGEITVNWKALE